MPHFFILVAGTEHVPDDVQWGIAAQFLQMGKQAVPRHVALKVVASIRQALTVPQPVLRSGVRGQPFGYVQIIRCAGIVILLTQSQSQFVIAQRLKRVQLLIPACIIAVSYACQGLQTRCCFFFISLTRRHGIAVPRQLIRIHLLGIGVLQFFQACLRPKLLAGALLAFEGYFVF